MIRVNLLEQPKMLRPKAAPAIPAYLPMAGAFLGGLLVSLAYLYSSYLTTGKELEQVRRQIAPLSGQMTAQQQLDIQLRQTEQHRIEIQRQLAAVSQLSGARNGGGETLSKLAASVGRTDGLWLTNFQMKGVSASIQGVAGSLVAVANLITALRASGFFTQVEISEAKEDANGTGPLLYDFALTAQANGTAASSLPAGKS